MASLKRFVIISDYTRSQAIADGVLVDLSAHFPELCQQIYKYPVACSSAVWLLVEEAVADKKSGNSPAGVVWDILFMSYQAIERRLSEFIHIFTVIIDGAYHTLKLHVGPGDRGEPVITIMLLHQD